MNKLKINIYLHILFITLIQLFKFYHVLIAAGRGACSVDKAQLEPECIYENV